MIVIGNRSGSHLAAIADESWGKNVSVKKRDGYRSGELAWKGEVKANLRGVADTYYIEIAPTCLSEDGFHLDEHGKEISLILPLRVNDQKE